MIHLPKRERETTRPPSQQEQVQAQEEEDEEGEEEGEEDEEKEEEGEDEGGGLAAQGKQGKKRMQSERKRKDKEPPLKLRALAPSPHVAQRASAQEKREERDEMLDGQSRTPLFPVAKQKTDMCTVESTY